MNWIEVIMLIVVIWGGSSIANSLHQIARDVEHIKEILVRKETQSMNPRN
jgi:hypothetical protein